MLYANSRRLSLSFAFLVLVASPLCAQNVGVPVVQPADPNDWARKMFDQIGHDFGTVARGTEVSHRFKVTNLYKEDVRISNITTTCGCTAPKFDQTPVKSLDSTYIDISMDTNKFQHEKSSTVTIVFDQPQYAEVKFPVKVYIRSDVVITPSSVNFGGVDKGATQDRTLSLAYAYNEVAGRPDWKVVKVVTNNKYLKGQAIEKARGNGQVLYDLIISLLPNAPLGVLRQQISLETDDAASPTIPLLVQARIEADVTITPSIVQLGVLKAGQEGSRTVVLRGMKPFVIQRVECESARQAFKMPPLTSDSKPLHILSLNFTAPKEPGPFVEKFIVTVEGRPEPLVFTARGTIDGPIPGVAAGK